MGEIVVGCVMPHPPVAIPEIGQDRLRDISETVRAMREMGGRLVEQRPDLTVVISPHSPLFRDAIAIAGSPRLKGDFSTFGAPTLRYDFTNDPDFVTALKAAADEGGIQTVIIGSDEARIYRTQPDLDHGVLVPMHYIKEQGYSGPLVCMGFAMLPFEELYRFGTILQRVIRSSDHRVAIVASGDLSHRLTRDAPAGYHEDASKFDQELVACLASGDFEGVVGIDRSLIEKAGECGLRSIIMLLGAVDGYSVKPEVLSYQGPFGVGYGIIDLRVGQADQRRPLLEQLLQRRRERIGAIRENEDELVALCRHAVEAYIATGEVISPPSPLPKSMSGRAGVFCSIKKHGDLRGCIGTIQPTYRNIAEEIIHNAISAATEDPRFDPVGLDELDDLVYSVDVLSPPEQISGPEQLDVQRYGVIVTKGFRRGLLLPNLEGVDTVEDQISIAKRKAGIHPSESVELQRFEVVRHH